MGKAFRKGRLLGLLGAAVALAFQAVPASATVIIQTYDITGSNFQLLYGSNAVAPIDPIFLNLTLSFDNSVDFSGTTNGMTINSTNIPYALQFAYSATYDFLTIATQAGVGSCNNPANSFCAFISGASGLSPSASLVQQSTSAGGYYTAVTQSVTVSGVPEPGTWAMMLLGFGAMGVAMRRRRRTYNLLQAA